MYIYGIILKPKRDIIRVLFTEMIGRANRTAHICKTSARDSFLSLPCDT